MIVTQKKNVPQKALVNKYLPVNYKDIFECTIENAPMITADDIQVAFWTVNPKWLENLYRIRNTLVKPFGLKGDENRNREEIERCISEGGNYGLMSVPDKSENETVLYLSDKHLSAHLSVYIEYEGNKQIISVITLVKFHNWLGYTYFYAICPFHHIVVRKMLKYAVKTCIGKDIK